MLGDDGSHGSNDIICCVCVHSSRGVTKASHALLTKSKFRASTNYAILFGKHCSQVCRYSRSGVHCFAWMHAHRASSILITVFDIDQLIDSSDVYSSTPIIYYTHGNGSACRLASYGPVIVFAHSLVRSGERWLVHVTAVSPPPPPPSSSASQVMHAGIC